MKKIVSKWKYPLSLIRIKITMVLPKAWCFPDLRRKSKLRNHIRLSILHLRSGNKLLLLVHIRSSLKILLKIHYIVVILNANGLPKLEASVCAVQDILRLFIQRYNKTSTSIYHHQNRIDFSFFMFINKSTEFTGFIANRMYELDFRYSCGILDRVSSLIKARRVIIKLKFIWNIPMSKLNVQEHVSKGP